MRRDGDLLIEHVASAKVSVLLCAPFIKAGVVSRLLAAIHPSVAVEIITRWHPEEIAAGVSDLAIFDLARSRPRTTLRLLDNLHAKLYFSDEALLVGSANLTATALGWSKTPNLELLVAIAADDEAVIRCKAELAVARQATLQDRDEMQTAVDLLQQSTLREGEEVNEALATTWLPTLAAPERLYMAYTPSARSRLTAAVIDAADHDLSALNIAPNLSEAAFLKAVSDRLTSMPGVAKILDAARHDLTDEAAADIVHSLVFDAMMTPSTRWQIVREWLTFFLREKYEIAPQSFVTRLRPGAGRP